MSLSKREHPVKTKTPREDEHVKAEAETEIMLHKPRDTWRLPEAGRYKEGFFSRGFRGGKTLPTP